MKQMYYIHFLAPLSAFSLLHQSVHCYAKLRMNKTRFVKERDIESQKRIKKQKQKQKNNKSRSRLGVMRNILVNMQHQ